MTVAYNDIVAMTPNLEWSRIGAQAEMTLFPGLPARKRSITWAVILGSKALWSFRSAFRKGLRMSNLRRLLETTGGDRFVLQRPARDHH